MSKVDYRTALLKINVYVAICLDLEIRITVLEESVSDQSVAIANLQEADIGLEQRIEDLEESITGNYFDLKLGRVLI